MSSQEEEMIRVKMICDGKSAGVNSKNCQPDIGADSEDSLLEKADTIGWVVLEEYHLCPACYKMLELSSMVYYRVIEQDMESKRRGRR